MSGHISAGGHLALVSFLIVTSSGRADSPVRILWGGLKPGIYPVGYESSWQLDYSRRYNMMFNDKTMYAPGKAPRPILINVWYPAAGVGTAPRMPHRDYLSIVSDDSRLTKFSAKLVEFNRAVITQEVMGQPVKDLTDPARRLLNEFLDTPTACVRNAAPADGRFPIVVYHSGHGSSFEDNSVLCEFLASHGFVVIGSTFQKSDGSSFGVDGGHTSALDMEFLVAKARQIPSTDWNHVGVVGHSGGAHAALTYASQPGAVVDAVVSLDTTQDYHGLKDPGWDDLTTLVVKNRANFTSPLLMVAGPQAFFELADTLRSSRRYYLTIKDMGHDDYIAQGGIGRERRGLLHPEGPKKPAEGGTEEAATLATVKVGYEALCLYILRFLEAELKGDAAAKDVLAKQYRDSKLGGAEPHVEFVPDGCTGPDRYQEDSVVPPTPRQLHRLLRDQGSAKTIGVLRRFREEVPAAPVFYPIAEFNLVCDLLDEGKSRDAVAFHDYYRESGLDCNKLLLQFAKGAQGQGRTKQATTFFKRLVVLDPASREAADGLKELGPTKKEH
jgi:hypothetical protein